MGKNNTKIPTAIKCFEGLVADVEWRVQEWIETEFPNIISFQQSVVDKKGYNNQAHIYLTFLFCEQEKHND